MREGGTIECAFPEESVHLIVMNGFDDVKMDVISFQLPAKPNNSSYEINPMTVGLSIQVRKESACASHL